MPSTVLREHFCIEVLHFVLPYLYGDHGNIVMDIPKLLEIVKVDRQM